jgi:hypothetical protein
LIYTQVKRRRVRSAPEWVTAARYKMVAAVGFWCSTGGLLQVDFLMSSGSYYPCADVFSSGDDGVYRQERWDALRNCQCLDVNSSRMVVDVVVKLFLCQTSRGNSRQASGRSYLKRGNCSRQYKANLYGIARGLAILAVR